MTIKKNIAGISMKGGRRDNFFLCLIEYYDDQKRWFLKSLVKVKDVSTNENIVDNDSISGDEIIKSWINEHQLHHLVVDIPLSYPSFRVDLRTARSKDANVSSVKVVQQKIRELLDEDLKSQKKNPKGYELQRVEEEMFDAKKCLFERPSHQHLLSRSFKRRLKKGFLPYWNRPLDLWVWMHYYDLMLELFNVSFDSFGNTSLMNLFRFDYLRGQLDSDLQLYEGNFHILLIELLRAKIISIKDVHHLSDLDLCGPARMDIIKKIETKLGIFIYDHDLEILVKNPRAFESFAMAVIGRNIHYQQIVQLPDWACADEAAFCVPSFNKF